MNYMPMSASIDPSVISLDQALVNLISRGDIPHGRIDRVKCAVTKAGRLLRKSTAQLPAHLPYLMRQLNRTKPGPGEKGRKTLANTKSELRFLVRTVTGKGRATEFVPLSHEWAALRAHVANQPVLWKLSRFMAFCSASGITPERVDDKAVQAFRRDIVASQDSDKPEQHVRAAIRAWNRCINEYQGWPNRPLHLEPPRKYRWTLEESRFCESFQQDVTKWLDRLSRPDRLSAEGPRRALRSATIKHRRHQIYKAASALVMSGFPNERLVDLSVLIDPDNFTSALEFLLNRQNGVQTDALFGLANALRAVAKHHVKAPAAQLNLLRRISLGLEPQESRLGVRSEERLEPFEDERVLAALLHLPRKLLGIAERKSVKPRYAAVYAQVAIAIEIELFAPLRLKNLTELNLNQQIQEVQKRGKTHWIVRVNRADTKNSNKLTYVIPHDSVAFIKRALRLYDQKGGWLFPGRGENHKREKTLGDQISEKIESNLSAEFNTHLFRALGATLHLKENPNAFEAVRAFLGDRDDTVIRHSYTSFAERHLIAAAQNTILKSRARLAPQI